MYHCFKDDPTTAGSHNSVASELLRDQRIVFVGAGSAGCGIAEHLVRQMVSEGLDESLARNQIYMVDRFGLLTSDMDELRDFQKALTHEPEELSEWQFSGNTPSLLDVVHCGKPTILIGVSGQPKLFTEHVIKAMHENCEQPIVFPLSNPSSRIEASPEDIIEWTAGQAIIATGSPCEPIVYQDKVFEIPQCNNSYIFPGVGLGVLAVKATRISDDMLMAASKTLAEASPLANTGDGGLLPALNDLATLSKRIAFDVAKCAMAQGLALEISDHALTEAIDKNFWLPEYRQYKRVSI